jgi:hypothetical protein
MGWLHTVLCVSTWWSLCDYCKSALGVAAMNNADRRATADPTNHLPRASLRRWCRHAIRTNHQLHVRVVRQEKEPCLRYHVRRVTTTFHTTANIFEVVEWVVFSARFCLRSSLSA